MPSLPAGFPVGGDVPLKGGRHTSVKTLKRVLKAAGLKTSGRKSALTRRAKKAHLKVGGDPQEVMGGRRRSRRRGGAEGTCSDSTKMTEEDCVAPATWTPATVEGGRRRRSGRSRKH